MLRFKKLFSVLLPIILIFGVIVGCDKNNGTGKVEGEFDFHTSILSEDETYNERLFFLNTLKTEKLADPCVIYVDEGEEAGWFYAYGTSDGLPHTSGFFAWRSKDLSNWEAVGVAYRPDFSNAWSIRNHFAPEVIYEDGTYYMFFNAAELAPASGQGQRLSVATSRSPAGPFHEPVGERDGNGVLIPARQAVFNKLSQTSVWQNAGLTYQRDAIDIHPFTDPETNKKYVYFTAFGGGGGNQIYGMEMMDWFTPKYETLVWLTQTGKVTPNGTDVPALNVEGGINEGAFVMYKDGKYILTYSVYTWQNVNYQVRQAIGDSPLGPFTKIPVQNGGLVLSTADMSGKMASSGHHSFFYCGDELFISYHTFKDRSSTSGGRALAIDRVEYVKNAQGQNLLRVVGPSYSLQPLPEFISGYNNIAKSATVTSNNTADTSDVALLTDSLIKTQSIDGIPQYEANEGRTNITFDFGGLKTARAVMVYNSFNYQSSFVSVENIELTIQSVGKKGATQTAVVNTGRVNYDWDWLANTSEQFMYPGGSVAVEFDDMPVSKITISIQSASGADCLEIPEIIILGKDAPVAAIAEFTAYEFTNPQTGPTSLQYYSTNFGDAGNSKGSAYAFDLSHDDNTADRYITQNWVADQYIYFNNINTNKFFFEAEFTVTEANAYPHGSSRSDAAPKFGLIVTDDTNTAHAFFFVEADGFTRKRVGVTERNAANTDWNWSWPGRFGVDTPSINYSNGSYVKLGIVRDGVDFHFFVDGNHVHSYSGFTNFFATTPSTAGIRSFSSPLKIKNYTATTSVAVIDEWLAKTV